MYDIRKARKSVGLTQEALAKKLNINRATISKYETGEISPTFEQLQAIAEALNISFIELFDPVIASALGTIVDNNINSADEAIRKRFGITGDYVVVETDNDDIRQLMQAYTKLNSEGQQIAVERIEELTQIPKYQRTKPPESFLEDGEYTDTPKQEKPPESLKTPSDGK